MNFQHILEEGKHGYTENDCPGTWTAPNTGMFTPRAYAEDTGYTGCDGGVIESSLGCYETSTYDSGVNQGKPIYRLDSSATSTIVQCVLRTNMDVPM